MTVRDYSLVTLTKKDYSLVKVEENLKMYIFHHKRVCIQILSDAFAHISNFSPTIKQPQTMDGALVGLGAIAPHKTEKKNKNKNKNIYYYIYEN